MKKILFFISLFFSISFYSQNDTISVVKTSEVFIKTQKVLYTGVKNRVFINVPNPETLIASSPGLTIENGNYYIFPNNSKEQTLFLSFKNNKGELVNEEHIFKVKPLPIVMGFINGYNCEKCIVELKREEIKNAIITLKFQDVFLDIKFDVTKFRILLPKKIDKKNYLEIDGNSIDEKTFEILNKLKKGSEFIIFDFGFNHSLDKNLLICQNTPINVKITN